MEILNQVQNDNRCFQNGSDSVQIRRGSGRAHGDDARVRHVLFRHGRSNRTRSECALPDDYDVRVYVP